MYCRNCGQKLADGDKFCSSCGAKTILTNESDKTEDIVRNTEAETILPQAESTIEKSEPLFEPFDFKSLGLDLDMDSDAGDASEQPEEPKKPVAPVEDFDWNIHSFPGMEVEKTEDIDFNWSMSPDEVKDDIIAEPAEASAPSNEAAVQEPEVILPQETESKLENAPEAPVKKEAATSLEEELFGGLDSKTDEAKKQAEEIDKFFTFHKKNEEFQKLLDQEYEKIKSGNILTEEMNTAAAASEEKFASRQPEDPMEELFASEGVVKGYEPKPVETDVLERIEAAEAEKKAREEAARLIEEEKAKARAEAEKRAAEEAEAERKARAAEEAARMRLEEEAKRAADARAAEEAAERERARAAAREEAEAAIRAAEEKAEQARKEAEAKLAEQTARLKAEEEARRAEAEKRAREEAEARARAEAEERAKAEAEAAAKAAAEKDPSNHISEMVRARETFFGQDAFAEQAGQEKTEPAEAAPEETLEGLPEKTKAVDKAAILAGMATASEMVQRDRAFAAAKAAEEAAAAKEAQPEPEPESAVDFTDFLEQLGEADEPEVFDLEPEELTLEPEEEEIRIEDTEQPDVLQQLEDIASAEPVQDLDELPTDLFSVEELIEEEPAAEEENFPPAKQVTDETLIMTEESVADLLNSQTAPEGNQAQDHTMVFPADFNLEEKAEQVKEILQGDSAQEISSFVDFEDEDYEEEGGGKGRIVLKICLVILIILLMMEIAGVVIKVAAPTSGAAKFIDTQLNNVIQMVTGDDSTEYSVLAATEDIRQEPIEDKTALIKAEMGKNKDGNIQSIEYNADLKFDPDKTYENTDLNLTQNLADVTWYKDANNKQVYYDQAIVGAMIAYDSQKVNLINHSDRSVLSLMKTGTDLYKEVESLGGQGATETFKSLQIGEIRQAGSLYYIWVAEKVENTQIGNSDKKKIYEMEPDGETMKIVASYEA